MELSVIDKKLAMDSRDIARLTKKRHSHVLRDIRNMLEKLDKSESKNGSSYVIRTYKNSNNVTATYYLLNYELTITLLTGYSVELRSAVVKRWIQLEKHYQSERKKSIEIRNSFTDELKDRGYTEPHEYIQTTMQMKKALGISHKKNEMSAKEIKAVRVSEAMSSLLLDDEYGFHEVNPVCLEASFQVAGFLASHKRQKLLRTEV